MNEAVAKLVHYSIGVGSLLIVTIVLAVTHNDTGALVALGALCGIATGTSPSSSIPRPVVAAGVLAVALVLGSAVSGCGGGIQVAAVVKPSCAAIRVLDQTCAIVDPVVADP